MIGAGQVALGRDNTGAAAIVDSTQDNSFFNNMLSRIADDEIRKKAEAKKQRDELKAMQKPFDFDPTGDEAADAYTLEQIGALEDYDAKVMAKGGNPYDPTTEAGREHLRMSRQIEANNALAKANAKAKGSVIAALDQDGVNVKKAMEWIKGYDEVVPDEGETKAQAQARYIQSNPRAIEKIMGTYEFVKPIIDNIVLEDSPSGVKRLNKEKTMNAMRLHLIGQGGAIAEAMGVDLADEAALNKFLEDQYNLIELANPTEFPAPNSSSSYSSSGDGDGGSDFRFEPTYSSDKNMYQKGGNNGIKLNTKLGAQLPARKIEKPDNTVIDGIPNAIVKDKDGNLFLEYFEVTKSGSQYIPDVTKKQYLPYDLFRDEIENLYGEDIALKIQGEGDASGETKEQRIARIKAKAAGQN